MFAGLCQTAGYFYIVYFSYLSVLLFVTHSVAFELNGFVWIIGLISTVSCYLYLIALSIRTGFAVGANHYH